MRGRLFDNAAKSSAQIFCVERRVFNEVNNGLHYFSIIDQCRAFSLPYLQRRLTDHIRCDFPREF